MESVTHPPKDFRYLRKWLTMDEFEDVCTRHNIKKAQGYHILSGKSNNWKFIDSMVAKVKVRMGEVEKTQQMEKHLLSFQSAKS